MGRFSKIVILTLICITGLLNTPVFGQDEVFSSQPSYIVLRNKVVEVSETNMDFHLPFTILYPKSYSTNERIFNSDADKLNIIGKLEVPEHTSHLYINKEEIDFSEGGMFFKIVELTPGRNVFTITHIPDYGKTVIAKILINYIQE